MNDLNLFSDRGLNQWPRWPDARGWIGIGVFVMSIMLIWMMRMPELRGDEFFQTIATVIITSGWMSVVSWAYAATKGGGELADKNAEIVNRVANHAAEGPRKVEIEQPQNKLIPTTDSALTGNEEVPDYARG